MAVWMLGIGKSLGQLMQPPCIILQVLFVFRIHGSQFSVQSFSQEQRGNEKLGKAIKSALQVLVADFKVVVGRGRCSVGVRVARVLREVLRIVVLFGILRMVSTQAYGSGGNSRPFWYP